MMPSLLRNRSGQSVGRWSGKAVWRGVLAVGLLSQAACAQIGPSMAPSSDARTMTFVPVTFTPPEPERVVLENGIVVYLLEDHELPLVTINAIIRAGSWLDSQDTVGLAALTGAVMRTGGTATMSPDQVDAELERMAAAIGIGMSVESGSASLDVLKKDLPAGLKIFGICFGIRRSIRLGWNWPNCNRSKAFDDGRISRSRSPVVSLPR